MRNRHLAAALAILVATVSGGVPSLAQDAPAAVAPSDPAALAEARAIGATLKQLETALFAYHDAHQSWPANVGALLTFATANGHPIDVGVIPALALQVQGDSVLVTFEGGPAYPSQGAFALTRRTVR
ncbi:hypothetical protein [Zavarzinia sp. CC-PAN008]|uniref:hypothetical protein n=1 Tax=Zavarzinia sp. CC-PAN008 TaxID=3243332 RepID=UPI003F742DDB